MWKLSSESSHFYFFKHLHTFILSSLLPNINITISWSSKSVFFFPPHFCLWYLVSFSAMYFLVLSSNSRNLYMRTACGPLLRLSSSRNAMYLLLWGRSSYYQLRDLFKLILWHGVLWSMWVPKIGPHILSEGRNEVVKSQ